MSQIHREVKGNYNMTHSEISERVGFEDQSYLSKFFLKEVGKTPSEYRKEMVDARKKDESLNKQQTNPAKAAADNKELI